MLPRIQQHSAPLERVITQMAVPVTQKTNDNRLARQENATWQVEPKLPSEKFSITFDILQGYLQVTDERELPPLWHHWANCTKWQEFQILTDSLQNYACGPEAFPAPVPIASPRLTQDLLNFTFVSDTTDDAKTALQPFIINHATVEHCSANLIDDFMLRAQWPKQLPTLNSLLHAIHAVFHDHTDSPHSAVISHSKLHKGDATFSTQKPILGWDIDTHTITIAWPLQHLQNLHTLIHQFINKQHTCQHQWRHLLGTLRRSIPALYGETHNSPSCRTLWCPLPAHVSGSQTFSTQYYVTGWP